VGLALVCVILSINHHVRRAQGWTTMACHVYELIYYKVMMIAVCDMQSEDTEVQCMLWRKLNTIVEKKRMGTPMFKGFMADSAQANGMLFRLFMGLEILWSRWLTKSKYFYSIGLNLLANTQNN